MRPSPAVILLAVTLVGCQVQDRRQEASREPTPRPKTLQPGQKTEPLVPSWLTRDVQAAIYVLKSEADLEIEEAGTAGSEEPPLANPQGVPISIPHDTGARWGLIDLKDAGEGGVMVFTHRIGKRGETFSIRQYDCKRGLVRTLATGETRDLLKRSKPDDSFSPINDRSIAHYLGRIACPT